jgi:rare lipoprotein A
VRLNAAQRPAVLAAIGLLGAAIALAVTSDRHRASALPPAVGAYTALAGSSGTAAFGRHTTCGGIIGARTEGVAHPVLPCGVRVYITYNGEHVLTQVIDRGQTTPGRQFDLTDALARRIGLSGVQRIRWSYAGKR